MSMPITSAETLKTYYQQTYSNISQNWYSPDQASGIADQLTSDFSQGLSLQFNSSTDPDFPYTITGAQALESLLNLLATRTTTDTSLTGTRTPVTTTDTFIPTTPEWMKNFNPIKSIQDALSGTTSWIPVVVITAGAVVLGFMVYKYATSRKGRHAHA